MRTEVSVREGGEDRGEHIHKVLYIVLSAIWCILQYVCVQSDYNMQYIYSMSIYMLLCIIHRRK